MSKRSNISVEKKGSYSKAALDGFVALLSAGRESTDGVPMVKGVLGGLLWVAETCRVSVFGLDDFQGMIYIPN